MNEQTCRFGQPPPGGRMLIWEVTNACNLECRHCCTSSGPSVSTRDDVPDECILAAIRDFRAVQVREVMFSGGEPFLRGSLMEFIRAASAGGADVYVASNGTLISRELASELNDARIRRIDISLDGYTAAVHQALRVHPTAFSRTRNGIIACVNNGVPLRVSSVVTPASLEYLDDLVGMLVDIGVQSLVIGSIQKSSGRAAHYPDLHMHQNDEGRMVRTVEILLEKYEGRIKIDCRALSRFSTSPSGCPAGARVLHISPSGDVSPCSWLYKISPSNFTLGNLKHRSLQACVGTKSPMLHDLSSRTENCIIPYVPPPKLS